MISPSEVSPLALDLKGKHVVVTGGTHGIGAAVASIAVAAGAVVSICARTERDVARSASSSPSYFGCACDVSDASAVESFFDRAVEHFGTVHGVIHAAAIMGPIGSIVDVDPDEWLAAIRIDLFGAFLVTREACLRMRRTGGRIALFSGGGAATPFPNYTAYACSKAGVVRFVESVALEMAQRRIAINAVAPGFVATRIHRETLAAGTAAGEKYLRFTEDTLASGSVPPEVGARCAAWLVSDAADGISGKFVAAPYDDYLRWPEHDEELRGSDLFTIRRIVPRDRGLNWQ